MISTSNTEQTKSRIVLAYEQVRNQTTKLCKPLRTEDFVVQPMTDVSPPKWHLGHTTWFFENFILAHFYPDYQLFNPRYNYFFNSYYESQGPRILRSDRGNMTRPSVDEIMDYRKHVDEKMGELLLHSAEDGELSQPLAQLVETGLQHEQQHQELLVTDLKYILGNNPLFPAYCDKKPNHAAPHQPMEKSYLPIPEGVYQIGYQGSGFCWDNELSRHRVFLEPFQIAEQLVTNGEYLEFMEAGGYQQFQHWLGEGWEWVQSNKVESPLYWFRDSGKWMQYTLRGLEPVNLAEPVTHISYYEADAFARWMCKRLPTEAEWEVACRHLYRDIPESGNFLEKGNFHPVGFGVERDYQLLGNVWEWTSSAYLPYPGYRPFEGALGEYNGKFMINQMVLRGGSCATPFSHIRMTYRNFFHPDKRWQFTGIRLAK